MKQDFEERREKRIETAQQRALKNETESNFLYKKAKEMASMIPLGQPILVGHHSEKGDRNYMLAPKWCGLIHHNLQVNGLIDYKKGN